MQTKLFKVIDTDTEINVMATRMRSEDKEEKNILKSAGYGEVRGLVILTVIDPESIESSYNVFNWGRDSSLMRAHIYIEKNFDELKSGQVIDVRRINNV